MAIKHAEVEAHGCPAEDVHASLSVKAPGHKVQPGRTEVGIPTEAIEATDIRLLGIACGAEREDEQYNYYYLVHREHPRKLFKRRVKAMSFRHAGARMRHRKNDKIPEWEYHPAPQTRGFGRGANTAG